MQAGKYADGILTRFPPEPNGYLHIGHAKAICVNFGLAEKYKGATNLRFDDTNPTTEDTEYVESIKKDIKWLGFEWKAELYASDYFENLYNYAVELIQQGLAYVDDSTPEEIAAMKGSPIEPGTDSPYKKRSIEENLDLFRRMKEGEFEDGSRVLRANVDMASPNMLMRDPIMYRIKHEHHHRTDDDWCIYPMYDFAHGQSDSIEGITHSLCSLEFIHHRPLYDWFIEKLRIFPCKQYEFARMNVEYMITSKRKLLKLVQDGYVTGWDDPRMPTISGMRRRGYPPMAIRQFCDKAGVAKRENTIEINLLEACVREELNKTAERAMVVLDPIKLIIQNYPIGASEPLHLELNPEDPEAGHREITFSRELYIEREDFMKEAPNNFFRLKPGGMARLKHAFIVECTGCKEDENGQVTEINAIYFPESKSGQDTSGLKVKGTLHWVNATDAVDCQVKLYDRLFTHPTPGEGVEDFLEHVNTNSLVVLRHAKADPGIMHAPAGKSFQFLRHGYFCVDPDSGNDTIIFNKTVGLKDSWSKEKNK